MTKPRRVWARCEALTATINARPCSYTGTPRENGAMLCGIHWRLFKSDAEVEKPQVRPLPTDVSSDAFLEIVRAVGALPKEERQRWLRRVDDLTNAQTFGSMLVAREVSASIFARRQEAKRRRALALPDHYVYYLGSACGSWVKIGTSKNPVARVSTLQREVLLDLPGTDRPRSVRGPLTLLATEMGPLRLERERHKQFIDLRYATTEWFRLSDTLNRHIASIQKEAT